jgi:hypothetical protein
LVQDVVAEYVRENGKWPSSWRALEQTKTTRSEIGEWHWPDDTTEIQNRINIDFSSGVDDVAKMTSDDFTAIQQSGPHCGVGADVTSLIDAAIAAATSTPR